MSNHRLIGSKGCALGGSRAQPWSCFLPWFPRAGNGHEVFAEGRWAKRAVSWMYPFGSAGVTELVGSSTRGDHHVATTCADDRGHDPGRFG